MKNPFESYRNQFSENKFWQKLGTKTKMLGIKIVYAALLLYYAHQRKETPYWAKSIVLGVLGYLLSPIDLIPDLTPFLGYTDDLGVLSFGIVTIAAFINKDVKEKAHQQILKWFKKYDEKELKDIDNQLNLDDQSPK